jgi:hypothetical protein
MAEVLTSHQILLRNHTTILDGTPKQVRIQRTVFVIVDDTTLSYNGESIPVHIRYFTPTSLVVEFTDVPAIRRIVGPVHFIQLNKIYVFDIELDIDDLDHLYFTTESNKQIVENLICFIKLYNGTIVEHFEDWIVVRCHNKALITFTLHRMEMENGYVVELSSTLKHNLYSNEYNYYATLFDVTFNPKVVDYMQQSPF